MPSWPTLHCHDGIFETNDDMTSQDLNSLALWHGLGMWCRSHWKLGRECDAFNWSELPHILVCGNVMHIHASPAYTVGTQRYLVPNMGHQNTHRSCGHTGVDAPFHKSDKRLRIDVEEGYHVANRGWSHVSMASHWQLLRASKGR